MSESLTLPSAVALYHYKHESFKIVHEVFYEITTSKDPFCKEVLLHLGEDRLFQDIEFFSSVLYNSGVFSSFDTFYEHLGWRYRVYLTRGIGANYFLVEFEIFIQKIRKYLHQSHAFELTQLFHSLKAIHPLLSEKIALKEQRSYAQEAMACTQILLDGSFDRLLEFTKKSLADYDSFYLFFQHVVSVSLYAVGELWEKNEISVAKEHLATSLALELLEYYKQSGRNQEGVPLRVIVATLESELHIVGAQSVSSFLDSCGVQTLLLTKIKNKDLIHMLYDYKPQALILSVTLVSHLDALATLVDEIRNNTIFKDLKIIVGGQALAKKSISIAGSDFQATSLESLADFLLQRG